MKKKKFILCTFFTHRRTRIKDFERYLGIFFFHQQSDFCVLFLIVYTQMRINLTTGVLLIVQEILISTSQTTVSAIKKFANKGIRCENCTEHKISIYWPNTEFLVFTAISVRTRSYLWAQICYT